MSRKVNVKTKPLDRRRKYYLVLDCETATLPYAANFDSSAKKKIAIAKPLIYDLGWQVIDRRGKVHRKKSYLISEIFSVPAVFNTAYYANKRPIYVNRLQKGETTLTDWKTAINDLLEDMEQVESVGAYNSMFDFKKAIPFTEAYIENLYSENFYEWEKFQNKLCDKIVRNEETHNKNFNKDFFFFQNKSYPLFDIWGLSCKHILDNDEYRSYCMRNLFITESGKYYKTSAEVCYKFFIGDDNFIESHTAIEDAEIESEIFTEILRRTKNKFEMGIIYFPFRIIGRIEQKE